MSHIASYWAIRQRGISSAAKLVLMVLADFHNSADGGCFPSVGTLADVCCCDSRTIRRAIEELCSANLVLREEQKRQNGAQTSNQYHLNLGLGDELTPLTNLSPSPLTNLSPLEPVRYNQDSDLTDQTNSSLSFTDLLADEEPPNSRKIFWDEAIGSLMAMGLAEPTARSWLGKCLKMANQDQDRVAEIIQAALEAGTMDPVRYMAAALGGKKAKKKREIDDAFAELRAASDKRKAEWAADDDTGTGGGNDHVVLQPEPVSQPINVPEDGGKSTRKVSARRSSEVVRPRAWNTSEVKVSADDSGLGDGSE